MPNILIVDDDPELLAALSLLLRAEGHTVQTAQDGVLATTRTFQRRPDLVILDIGLPGGSGITVLERLRLSRRTASTPILVLTGSSDPQVQADAASRGATSFLRKPAEPAELLAEVKRLLTTNAAA